MNSFSHHAEFEDYATNKGDYAAELESRRVVAFTVHMWKITITSWVFYAAIKPRPGPWWNNPMLDNLLVTPVIFIKTGCGSLNWRCWPRALTVTAAIFLGMQLPSCLAASHLTEPQGCKSSGICVELTRKGLYCQGWYHCNVRYWYLSAACIKMK